jgi:hypothetical protein
LASDSTWPQPWEHSFQMIEMNRKFQANKTII